MAGFPRPQIRSFERAGILLRTDDADIIPHPHFPNSGRFVAVRETPRGREAVPLEDDEYFPPVPLNDGDDWQYLISLTKLVDLIRKQNAIASDGDAENGPLIAVGQKAIDGFGEIDVYLSLPNGDRRDFAMRCLGLRKPAGVKRLAVLVPAVPVLPSHERQLLDERGIVLVSLSKPADCGTLCVDWESSVVGATADRSADGVHAADTIVWQGREYRCDPNHEFGKREIKLMTLMLNCSELPLGKIFNRGKDAFWKQSYNNSDQALRNRVTQMLSRVNGKLRRMSPPFVFDLSLPRNRDSIIRDSAPLISPGCQPADK